ncbi:uncharacterized protein iftap isoform X3 [Ictalurus punctatus]|nr:uncharacterized protein iftap isoform X3 [Ictalurus punctatus]XP_053541633.1 uncharacterized protein iftap isoform X3 [Ictalurus punctatus]
MPGLQDGSDAVPQSMMAALELFCNLPEQSYEHFLSTFTHLSTENVTAGCLKVPEEENKTDLVELDRRDDVNVDRKMCVCFLVRLRKICQPTLLFSVTAHSLSSPVLIWTIGDTLHPAIQTVRAVTSVSLPRVKLRRLCLSVWMTPSIMTMLHCLTSILSNPATVDHHDLASPTLVPKSPGIGSGLPMTLCKISGIENGWMDVNMFTVFSRPPCLE